MGKKQLEIQEVIAYKDIDGRVHETKERAEQSNDFIQLHRQMKEAEIIFDEVLQPVYPIHQEAREIVKKFMYYKREVARDLINKLDELHGRF